MIEKYMSLLLISFLAIIGCSNNQNGNGKKVEIAAGINTEYEEVYLETEFPVVGCGNIFYAYGFKFKLIKNDSSIIGVIRCPDGYGDDFLKLGRKYKIKYTNKQIIDSLNRYSLTNPFIESKLSTYLITEIIKAP